jgi:hypothetical protein
VSRGDLRNRRRDRMGGAVDHSCRFDFQGAGFCILNGSPRASGDGSPWHSELPSPDVSEEELLDLSRDSLTGQRLRFSG